SEHIDREAVVTYERLWTGGVDVELPTVLRDRQVLAMGIPYDRGIDVHRRNDAAIVRSGRVGDPPPFQTMLRGGGPRLEITTHRALWTPGGLGIADLEAALDRLKAHGWRLVREPGRR